MPRTQADRKFASGLHDLESPRHHHRRGQIVAVTDLQSDFWGGLVDASLSFHADALKEMEFTFKEPPPVEELISRISAVLGAPAKKNIEAQYGTTDILWNATKTTPSVEATESQGILKLLYRPQE